MLDRLHNASPGVDQNSGFEAFGPPRNANGTADPTWGANAVTKRSYINQERLTDLHLIDLNARLYDPANAHFLSPDPVVSDQDDSQSWNAYAYAHNNPMSKQDPTGQDDECDGFCQMATALYTGSPLGGWLGTQQLYAETPGGVNIPISTGSALNLYDHGATLSPDVVASLTAQGFLAPAESLQASLGGGAHGQGAPARQNSSTPAVLQGADCCTPYQPNVTATDDRSGPIEQMTVTAHGLLDTADSPSMLTGMTWHTAGDMLLTGAMFTPFLGEGALAAKGGLTAAERVAQLAEGGLTQIQRERFVTLAVTEAKEGVRVISSSTPTLQPSVRALLNEGEIGVNGVGHAEVTGVEGARSLGLTPTGVAASRGICGPCADYLSGQGITPLTPLR